VTIFLHLLQSIVFSSTRNIFKSCLTVSLQVFLSFPVFLFPGTSISSTHLDTPPSASILTWSDQINVIWYLHTNFSSEPDTQIVYYQLQKSLCCNLGFFFSIARCYVRCRARILVHYFLFWARPASRWDIQSSFQLSVSYCWWLHRSIWH